MSPQTQHRASPRRSPLSRHRVLESALELVDAGGLDDLSMRKLAAELDVEAMSLYKHFAKKDELLGGLAELVWAEVAAASPPDVDWAAWLRTFGHAVRDAIHRHPRAMPVMLAGEVSPVPGLELFADQLDRCTAAERDRAVNALRAVFSFALGTAVAELSCLGPAPKNRDETERQRLLRISRALPPDTPERLIDAAMVVCDCDAAEAFGEGLELIVRGCNPDA